jgi:hypothetical protein
MSLPPRLFVLFASVLLAVVRADTPGAWESVTLDSLEAFRPVTNNWRLAGGIGGEPGRSRDITRLPGTGIVVSNPVEGGANDQLFTVWEHGDLELELEFLLTPRTNSGIYLQGRYEVQLFDSWGVATPGFADSGGIFQRWDPARGAGREGFDGHAPRTNASRPAGEWQRLRIVFRAPRFDAAGAKIANARIVRVELNGVLVQENVELTGPTRAAPYDDEKPLGPVMFQSNHGPVAFRALRVRR